MSVNYEGMDERAGVVEAFNNTLSKLLARMTVEQREKAIENKADNILNNIFISAFNLEHYEVCNAIKTLLDKRNADTVK